MRILFLAHRVPYPPDKGDRIRSYNIIKLLAKTHAVFLIGATHDPVHPDSYSVLRRYCKAVDIFKIDPWLSRLRAAFGLFSNVPLTLPLFYSGKLAQAVKTRLAQNAIDLVYIYSSPMAQYALTNDKIPKLMDFIDVDSQKWFEYAEKSRQPLKSLYYREGMTLRSFERKVAVLCKEAIFAAEREARLFRDIAPTVSCRLIPNGVHLNADVSTPCHGNRLVFAGAMDYLPNVDAMLYFTHQIFPLVQESVPDVELFIVGGNPSNQIRELKRFKNIVVTGYVEAIEPYMRGASVSVAPLRIARGTQQKILEAMALGVPVIATSVALGGIEAQPGKDALVADNPRLFAQKIVSVLKDPILHSSLRENALALVRNKYSWEHSRRSLEEAIMCSLA